MSTGHLQSVGSWRRIVAGRFASRAPRVSGNATLYLGLLIVIVMVGSSVLAPLVAPADPLKQNLFDVLRPPFSSQAGGFHVLGTDELGRDVLSRVIYGGRIPILVGFLAALCSGVFGTLTGAVAGYFGGAVDAVLSRLADIQLSIPAILVALSLLAIASGGDRVTMLVVVIAITGWPTFFRLIRVQSMSLASRNFVEAAVSAGCGPFRIIYRHILRNVVGLAVTLAMLSFSRAILMEAGLSYLGLGVQPPSADWGSMVADGQMYIADAWWIAACPAIAIIVLVLGVNLIGDWLVDGRRDANPQAEVAVAEVSVL